MILYIGTGMMLFFSTIFIWQVVSISKLKAFAAKRDQYYIQRIDGLEAIIRTEFKAILETLKT